MSVPLRGAAAGALVLGLAGASPAAGRTGAGAGCAPAVASKAYVARVTRALRAGADVWGNELLRAPGGPTFARASRYLAPLFLARRHDGPLTASGAHYAAFGQPAGPQGAGSVALHAADGSAIAVDRADGPRLLVSVGGERFGSCLARLGTPRLAEGWLPILQTAYRDARGSRWQQESFTARLPGHGTPTSFMRVTGGEARFTAGGRSVTAAAVAWPQRGAPAGVEEAAYESARASVVAYWERRLAEGTVLEVPERRVLDAERALLVQNLSLTWRYSIGNAYEEFSFPESVQNAELAAEYGHAGVARSILRTSLTRRPVPYPNWKMGQRLLAFALEYRLSGDRRPLDAATPVLRSYVALLGRQVDRNRNRLLDRERYSSDIPDSVYGLHGQAVVWQGLRELGAAWAATGRAELAARCRAVAGLLGAGLRSALRSSERRLPDGSLFVPMRLLDGERPYESLTASRPGSYWNLVAPFALASGLLPPGSPEARGALRYLLAHGSRLLGLVRASAFALYGHPVFPRSGTDQVYGLNASRFLADQDESGQLVLSLYGQLAAGMTQGTFVAGEAASVAPLPGPRLRSMYLPPNSTSNASFLETLRLLLVHETRGPGGVPRGLELAFATPRAWLAPGKRIAVRGLPTSFGPLSYELDAEAGVVRATVEVPPRPGLRELRLRVRLPGGRRISSVDVDGRPPRRLNRSTGTIDLSGLRGTLHLTMRHETR